MVQLDRGPTETLPASYLDAGKLDYAYAYAGTVHKAQGATVTTAHVLGTAMMKEAGYVALSRARTANRLYLVQGQPEPELDLPAPAQRDAYADAVRTLGISREKTLAVDSAVYGADSDHLAGQLAAAARLLRTSPTNDRARLPALHADLARTEQQLTDAQQRLDRLTARAADTPTTRGLRGLLRGPSQPDTATTAAVQRQTGVVEQLTERISEARALIAAVQDGTTERDRWAGDHAANLTGAVTAGRELAWRSNAQLHAAGAVAPGAAMDAPGWHVDEPEALEVRQQGQARTLRATGGPCVPS